MSRQLLLRLTRHGGLAHRLTVRQPLVQRVVQEAPLAQFLTTGAAPPQRAQATPARTLFRPPMYPVRQFSDATRSAMPTDEMTYPVDVDPSTYADTIPTPAYDSAPSPAAQPEVDSPGPATLGPTPVMDAMEQRVDAPDGAQAASPAPTSQGASPTQRATQVPENVPVPPAISPPQLQATDRRQLLRAVAAAAATPRAESRPPATPRRDMPTPPRPDISQRPMMAPQSAGTTPVQPAHAAMTAGITPASKQVTAMTAQPAVGSAAAGPEAESPQEAIEVPGDPGATVAVEVISEPVRSDTALDTLIAIPAAIASEVSAPVPDIDPVASRPSEAVATAPAPPSPPSATPISSTQAPDVSTPPTPPVAVPQAVSPAAAPIAPAAPTPTPTAEASAVARQSAPHVAEVRAARPPRTLVQSQSPSTPTQRDATPRERDPEATAAAPDAPMLAASPQEHRTAALQPDAGASSVADVNATPQAVLAPQPAASAVTDETDSLQRLATLGQRLFGDSPAAPATPQEEPAAPLGAVSAPPEELNRATMPPVQEMAVATQSVPAPEPGPIRAEDLFQSAGGDRSPESWITRLARAASPSPAPAPNVAMAPDPVPSEVPALGALGESAAPLRREAPVAPPFGATAQPGTAVRPPMVSARSPVRSTASQRPPSPSPTRQPAMPLPDGVRRFLAPAVGIDPAEVPIHRGERAESATTAHRADAITDGTEIALAAGNDTTESPETLGLIAHELTHVARQRDPLFVPPIVRPRPMSPQTAPAAAATSGAQLPGPSADEETIAQAVEARVVRAARAGTPLIEQPGMATAHLADDPPPRQAASDNASVFTSPALATDAPDRWGDLPRPWEPLPAWLTVPSDAPEAAAPWTNMLVMSAPTPAPMPAIQRADEGRSEIQEATGAQIGGPAQQPDHPAVEPDLDALSRQVYAILKRRLATERRSAR